MMNYDSEFATELHTCSSLVWAIRLLHDGSGHPRLWAHAPPVETNPPQRPGTSVEVRAPPLSAIFGRCCPSAPNSQFHIDPFCLSLRPLCASGGAMRAWKERGGAGRPALACGRGHGGSRGSGQASFESFQAASGQAIPSGLNRGTSAFRRPVRNGEARASRPPRWT